jgi:hypothetical protein
VHADVDARVRDRCGEQEEERGQSSAAKDSIVAAAKLVAACPDGNDPSCGRATSVFGSG